MSEASPSSWSAGRPWTRRADRRQGFAQFLTDLAEGLEPGTPAGVFWSRLEKGIQRLLPGSALKIREHAAAPSSPSAFPARIAAGPGKVLVLEPKAQARFDAWQRQLFDMTIVIAGLVHEIERTRVAGPAAHPNRSVPRPILTLIGSSQSTQLLRRRIERVASTDFTVLIQGESGSGKELVARQIHELSRRRRGPFVAVNCAALVETLLEAELFGIEDRTATGVRGRRGKFEHADGGTLFLDEVADLSTSAQAKLLRVIQDLAIERVGGHGSHRVDARIVAATNKNLAEQVEAGRFRADLYYRLNGVEIHVPPLRARREDLPELIAHFLGRHRAGRLHLSAPTADALQTYHWPGNVRELERVIERAVALTDSDEIGLDDLSPEVRREYSECLLPSLERAETIRLWGSRYVRLVLARHGNNKRSACRALGISYHTLQAYLRYRPPTGASGSGLAASERSAGHTPPPGT